MVTSFDGGYSNGEGEDPHKDPRKIVAKDPLQGPCEILARILAKILTRILAKILARILWRIHTSLTNFTFVTNVFLLLAIKNLFKNVDRFLRSTVANPPLDWVL
jgi:hypothetical protein